MAISQSRKASGLFVAAVLLGGTAAAFLPAMLATRDMRRFCDGLALGTPLGEVKSQSLAHDYGFQPVVGGHYLIEHPHSLGRAWCELGFDDKGLLSSKSDDRK